MDDRKWEKDGCRILYEDRDLLVCYKQPGLAVQSARLGVKDMVSILKTYLREQNPAAGEPYLGVVHRLDQPVRGLVLFAKNKKAAAALSSQLGDGRMQKRYLAIVRLCPGWEDSIAPCERMDSAGASENTSLSENADPESGNGLTKRTLVDYLIKDAGTNLSRVVPEGTPGAKRAELTYECMQVLQDAQGVPVKALLEIALHTGRHHQIRVQMAHAGMPLVGDRKYAPAAAPDQDLFPLLCAWKLVFFHPGTGRQMELCAPPDGIGFP